MNAVDTHTTTIRMVLEERKMGDRRVAAVVERHCARGLVSADLSSASAPQGVLLYSAKMQKQLMNNPANQ